MAQTSGGTSSNPSTIRQTRVAFSYLTFAGFLLLSVIWTWPLATKLTSRVAHDPGDPILNTWILWWNAQAVPFTQAWWDAPVFFPMRDALALSEHLAGLSPISTPLLLAGASPLGAYNIVLILTFALSGFFAYLLVLRLTGSRLAAACGGLAFGFSPYRVSQLGHLQVVASQWMPLLLLSMHAYVDTARRGWLVVFAAAWLLQALSNGYYLLFLPVLIGLWLSWFIRWRRAPQPGLMLAAVWAASSTLLIPVLLKYHDVHQRLGLTRSLEEIRSFSADAASFIRASPLLTFWPYVEPRGSEDQLFPGVMPIAVVAVAAIVLAIRRSPAIRRAIVDRSPMLFYAAAALLMWVLTLGPAPEEAGVSRLWHPYTVLAMLPGFEGLRVPARFAMLATLCIAVAAGLGVSALAPSTFKRRAAFAALVVAGFAADGWMSAMPLFPPPPRISLPDIPDAVVIELPPENPTVGVTSMYRSMFHGRPIASGYSGHLPPHAHILSIALYHGDPSALMLLAQKRPLILALHERHDPDGDLRRLVESLPGIERRANTGAGQVYVLPRTASAPVPEPGRVWPRVVRMDEGDRRIDLGAVRTIRTIGFSMRHRYLSLDTRLRFETSTDGKTWTTAWDDWTGAPALAGVLRDARWAPIRITLPDVAARYVRFAPAPDWLWREVEFYGP